MNLNSIYVIYTPSESINLFLVYIDKARFLNDFSQKTFYFIVIHFYTSLYFHSLVVTIQQ